MDKICCVCGGLKSSSGFYRDKRNKDGLGSVCRKCAYLLARDYQKTYQKKYRKEKVENIKALRNSLYYKQYFLEYGRKYIRERRASDPKFKLDSNMGKDILFSMRKEKKGRSWELLVGYSINDLMRHLEKQFDEKMNWGNHGFYWHIDHIKPKSLFKYKTAEDSEFKECWALGNLQPLEKIANIKKGNKYLIIN